MSQSRSPFWAPRNSHSRFDMGISNVDKSRFLHDSSLGLDGTWDKSLDMHASQRRTSGPKVTTSRGARPVSARPMSSLASSKDSINEDYRFLQEYRVDNNISMGRAVRPKSAPRERLPGMRAKADPKLSLSQIIDDHRSPDHRLEKVNLASFRLEDSMAGRRERSSRSFQVDPVRVQLQEPLRTSRFQRPLYEDYKYYKYYGFAGQGARTSWAYNPGKPPVLGDTCFPQATCYFHRRHCHEDDL